jgi:chitodextrinase
MQLWHGTTDATLRYPNFGEEIKQWTNVLGLSQTPSFTDTPQAGWTRTRYGGTGIGAPVEAISVANVGHSLPLGGQAAMAIQFFGLDTAGPGPGPGPDTQAPSVPASLNSPAQTSSSISLAWGASTDNVGVTGYELLRAPGTSGGTFATIATAPSNSFVDSGLAASSTFRYQVRARDAAGNVSAVSNTATATTQAGGTPGGGCTAVPTVQTQWQEGYVIEPVRVTNTGTATINSWTTTFTLPAGHTVSGSWNTVLTVSGQTVTARNAGHNGMLAPGTNTTFGFQVRRPNGNTQLPSGYACSSP